MPAIKSLPKIPMNIVVVKNSIIYYSQIKKVASFKWHEKYVSMIRLFYERIKNLFQQAHNRECVDKFMELI